MAFYFEEYWHFPVIAILIMVLSSLMYYAFPRLPFYLVPIASGVIGYVYALLLNLTIGLSLYMVIRSVYLAIIPIIVIECGLFLRRKADKLKQQGI